MNLLVCLSVHLSVLSCGEILEVPTEHKDCYDQRMCHDFDSRSYVQVEGQRKDVLFTILCYLHARQGLWACVWGGDKCSGISNIIILT